MTKDELNEVLKEDEMYLSSVGDGTVNNEFYVVNEDCVAVEFDGLDFIFARDFSDYRLGFRKEIVAALLEYANTPVEERKPKPQLYNIIIGEDAVSDRPFFTAWGKDDSLGEYSVNGAVEQYELLHNDYFKFTAEEVEDLKSKVSEKQKQIIDIGMVKVEETMTKDDKEIEKYVRLKGFLKTNGYLNYDVNFEKFFVDNTEPDSCLKIKFTKSWLKDNWSEYEAYNNAGLLEFEKVEDD